MMINQLNLGYGLEVIDRFVDITEGSLHFCIGHLQKIDYFYHYSNSVKSLKQIMQ